MSNPSQQKACPVCKNPYPAHLAACPNCAAAGKSAAPADELLPIELDSLDDVSSGGQTLGSDPTIDLESLTHAADLLEGSSSKVNLAPNPDPGSGASKVSWASLVKEKEESSEIDFGIEPSVTFDALSDADLRKGGPAKAPPAPPPPPAPAAAAPPPPPAPPSPAPLGPANLPKPAAAGARSLLTSGTGAGPEAPAAEGGQGAPTQLSPRRGAPTHLSPGKAPATQLAPHKAQATQLAKTKGAQTQLATNKGAPTQLAGEPGAPPKPLGTPTMLAPTTPAPTVLAPKSTPTTLAPPGAAEKEAQDLAEDRSKGPKGAPTDLDVLQNWFADPTRAPGKDPIADSVEAQVDLSGSGLEGMGPTSSGELAQSLMERPTRAAGETSAVDLGSVPPSDLLAGESRAGSPPAPVPESSAVDLGSHPSLELPFGADSAEKAALVGEAPPAAEGDATVALEPGAEGAAKPEGEEGELDWDKVPDADTTAVVEEEPAAEEKPTAPAPKPKYLRRWVGGGILGLLTGTAACFGLWLTGLPPFDKASRQFVEPHLRGMGLDLPAGGSAEGPASAERAFNLIQGGDFDQGLEMLGKHMAEDNMDHRAARGEAKWLQYLQAQKGEKPQRSAPAVKEAIEDLKAAKTPQAYFWLGHIQEVFGEAKNAEQSYRDGLKAAADSDKPKFEAALLRLKLQERFRDTPEARLPGRIDELNLRAQLLLTLLIQFQGGAAAPADADEAGYLFWKAAQAADRTDNPDYAEAIKNLQQAVKLHEKYRFQRLRKAQNPNSDPTEQIFVQSSKYLQDYWAMLDKLRKEYKQPRAADALQALLDEKNDLKDKVGKGDILPEVAKAAGFKEEDKPDMKTVLEKIKENVTARTTAETQLKALTDALAKGEYVTEDQKDPAKGLAAALKDADDRKKAAALLKDAGIEAPSVEMGVDKLAKENKDLKPLRTESAKLLADNGFLEDAAAPTEKVVEAVAKAVKATKAPMVTALATIMSSPVQSMGALSNALIKSVNLTGRLALAQNELAAYQAQIAVGGKAQGECLKGLALQSADRFSEAQAALQQALKGGGPRGPDDWRTHAQAALDKLSNPATSVLPRANELRAAGSLDAADAVLTDGMTLFPKDGRLWAMRSQVRLEKARTRAQGRRLTLNDPDVARALKDAQAAGGLAEGQYAAGRVYEETRNWAAAERSYLAAINAQRRNDPMAEQYRTAWNRVRLQQRAAAASGGNPVGQLRTPAEATPQERAQANRANALALLMLLTTGLQVDDEDQPVPDVNALQAEAIRAIRAGNYEGHLMMARVYYLQKKYTQALKEYVRGMEIYGNLPPDRQNTFRPIYAEWLALIVAKHPAFNRPDSLSPPDPILAEKHFAAGLRLFNAHHCAEAEEEFIQAVQYYDQDARYLYYLGLSRLTQGKKVEAAEDFRAGAMLERQNKPASATVSMSLERVQGPMRQVLNAYRP